MEAVSSPLPAESCWLDVAGCLITTDFCFIGQKHLYRQGVGALTPEEMSLAGCADMLSKRKDFFSLRFIFVFNYSYAHRGQKRMSDPPELELKRVSAT